MVLEIYFQYYIKGGDFAEINRGRGMRLKLILVFNIISR